MKHKLASTITRTILISLLAIVLGIGIYNFNATYILGDRLPMPFDTNVLVVLSGSMEPELSMNDMVVVKRTDEFYVGQIIVFQSGKILVVHRIISIDGDTLITQGDANTLPDDPISKRAVKGEVVRTIPYIGTLVLFLKNPLVICIVIAAAILLMERSFAKEKNKDRDELESMKDEIRDLIDELKK